MLSHIILFKTIFMTFSLATTDGKLWSCYNEGEAMPVIPSQVAGVWYEIARLPSSKVPACLEIVVPESQLNGSYTLELSYVNNVNKGWKPTKETLVFPWREAMNGNFNLLYSDGIMNISVNFKYLGSIKGYTIVCGYTNFATGLSIIRILSRNRHVNSTVKAKLDALASQYVAPAELTWVQQDGRCNGSENSSTVHIGLWIFLLFFQTVKEIFQF